MFIPTLVITGLLLLLTFLAYLGLNTVSLYGLYFLLVITIIYLITIAIDAYKVIIWGYAPYVRSGKDLIKRILQEVDFKEDSLVYELGCGDGRFLRKLVRQKKVNCVGYEYSLAPYLLARLLNLFTQKKIKIYYKNFFKESLSEANYIFCYLITNEMDALCKKFEQELRPGTIVISNTFAIKNWQPIKTIILDKRGFLSKKIYIYQI